MYSNIKAINHSVIKPIFWAVLMAGLNGCVVGPDFKRPEPPMSNSFTREKVDLGAKQNSLIGADWWKHYESPQLDRLVELALKHNANIEAASANLRVAQQNTIAQQGYYFPTITAGTSRTIMNPGGFNGAPSNIAQLGAGAPTYSVNSAGLSVGFVPDIFGANKRAVESLKAQENITKYQLAALQITVVTTLIQTVAQETTLREELRLALSAERSAFKQLEHVRKMTTIGYNSGVDLAAQESAYSVVASQVPVIRKLHDQSIDMLNVLCGELPSSMLSIPSIDEIKIPNALPIAIPSGWIEGRPDVKAAEEMVRSNNAQIGVAIAAMIPQISISGFTGATAGAFSSLKDSFNRNWSETISANQTVFAGGTLLARKRAAEANLDYSLGQYKSVVLTAFQNVADTLYALDQDKQSWEIAKRNTEANKKLYQFTQTQYDKGYASEPALLSAQQAYLASDISRIQAYALYLGDTAALYQSLGGGWSGAGKN